MHKLIQRPVADVTRQKIIKAARQLFAKKGFAATTVEQIALHAKVYQNLIFHHFKNKKTLWKAVKQSFVDEVKVSSYEQIEAAEELIHAIVNERFMLYKNNPDCCRMMLWQRLEQHNKELVGGNNMSPNDWTIVIKRLQKQKKIRPDVPSEYITAMLIGCVDAVTMPGQTLVGEDDKIIYIDHVTKLLIDIMVP